MADFEDRLTALETVIERLERGELSLDDSVRLFEEGVKLSNTCKAELEKAEGRIQVLIEGRGGKLEAADFAPEEGRSLEEEEEDEEE